MSHQPNNTRPASSDNENPAPLTLEQALQQLFTVLPYMPAESQTSFLTMAFGTTSRLPSHETPAVSTAPVRLPLAQDAIRGVIQAKTYVCCIPTFASIQLLPSVQRLRESDSAFETKQRTIGKSLKQSGGSKGVTKRYQKVRKCEVVERAARMAVMPRDPYTTPYGVPWNIGGNPVPGNIQIGVAAPGSCFHSWDSKDPSSSVRRYSPT